MSDADKKKKVIDISDNVIKTGEARYAKQDDVTPTPKKEKKNE